MVHNNTSDLPDLIPIERQKGLTREERATLFHKLNPHIYDIVVDMSLSMKRSGWKKAGIRMIWERLRWLYAVKTQGGIYKLNDHYTSFYARWVMENVPELQNFFEVRSRKE